MHHLRVLLTGLALLAASGPIAADDAKTLDPSNPKVARRPNDPARRVPPYFGQIGLTPEQREEIYKIRARHQVEIAELEAKIVQAQAASLQECEALLSETQKSLLAFRRESALKTRKEKAAAGGAEASTKPSAKADKSAGD